MLRISAILLGAGKSKRMGVDKLSLPLGRKTVLEHCFEALVRSEANEVIVVLGIRNKKLKGLFRKPKVKTVVNPFFNGGMSTSIRRGLQVIHPGFHGVLIALGDQPFLKTRTINGLIHAFEKGKRGIIVPSFRGRRGTPVIFHRRYKKELLDLKGDVGGRSIIERHPEDVRLVPVKSRGVVKDIDTWQDYKNQLRIMNEELRMRRDRETGGGERQKGIPMTSKIDMDKLVVLIRGAGDIASGVAHRLHRSHFKICMTEIPHPLAVRREVAFSEAIYEGEKEVEGIRAKFISKPEEIESVWKQGDIPILVDPDGKKMRHFLKPDVLVDAIMAKNNSAIQVNDAPWVIGLGPGFTAGKDVHVVIETNRGHYLGTMILNGTAEPDTGIPGEIGGYTIERVLRTMKKGTFHPQKSIGDRVSKGAVVAVVDDFPVIAKISGVVRGLLREGVEVRKGMKVGDIDPRGKKESCFTISDKARAIAGGVLEAILYRFNG